VPYYSYNALIVHSKKIFVNPNLLRVFLFPNTKLSVTCQYQFLLYMTEIERKFLVKNTDYKTQAFSQNRIAQGYLSSVPERTVRVRTKGDKGFLTIKGKGNETGTTRMEWEKEITVAEAEMLLAICEPGAIDKIRHEVQVGSHIYEVDEFFGENAGLTVAEIELSDENEAFEKPEWLGEEVTGQEQYYNAYLSRNPYTTWK
jgi:adenylate cyclase